MYLRVIVHYNGTVLIIFHVIIRTSIAEQTLSDVGLGLMEERDSASSHNSGMTEQNRPGIGQLQCRGKYKAHRQLSTDRRTHLCKTPHRQLEGHSLEHIPTTTKQSQHAEPGCVRRAVNKPRGNLCTSVTAYPAKFCKAAPRQSIIDSIDRHKLDKTPSSPAPPWEDAQCLVWSVFNELATGPSRQN